VKKKRKGIRDRYYPEDQPSNNFDYIEVLVDNDEALDAYINNSPLVQQALGGAFNSDPLNDDKERTLKKNQRLMTKVMKAATEVLTDRQLEIFYYRFVFGLTQEEIAQRLNRKHVGRPRIDGLKKKDVTPTKSGRSVISQPYIVQCLQTSIQKIQKKLRLKEANKNKNIFRKAKE
jgi:hypothetical protein